MILTKPRDIITVLLILANYVCWVYLFSYFNEIPVFVLVIFGSLTLAFQGSLQHELIHNHPFKSQKLNDFLGHLCGNPWVPYALYKESHLRHHQCEKYSHPILDPETFYVTKKHYDTFPKLVKAVFRFNQTLLGRMIFGPMISLFWVAGKEVRRVFNGDYAGLKAYIPHFIIWSMLLVFMSLNEISFFKYLFFVAYPGYSIILIRSFLEHRYADEKSHQTCIVESGWFFSLLFLNNNLHLVHHEQMSTPWYDLPKVYQQEKADWLKKNNHYSFTNYFEVFKKFMIKPKDRPYIVL